MGWCVALMMSMALFWCVEEKLKWKRDYLFRLTQVTIRLSTGTGLWEPIDWLKKQRWVWPFQILIVGLFTCSELPDCCKFAPYLRGHWQYPRVLVFRSVKRDIEIVQYVCTWQWKGLNWPLTKCGFEDLQTNVLYTVVLTHWRCCVTHTCVSKLTIIASDNGLSVGWR